MKGASPDLDIVGLLQDTVMPRPEILKCLDESLEGYHVVFSMSILRHGYTETLNL
jgi:hypothetical protein